MAKGESQSYDPASTEKRIFEFWEKGEHFRAKPDDRPREKRFCMVIPPPNVTGALHLGHALNNTLQDILIRQKRMAGCNTFWLVGTDHAGIATQATVEKAIRKEENKSRHDLGREELVRRIWDWKAKYGGRIIEQLRLMGCSCDYSRERFTLDEGCAKAVRETFFKLFKDGLIYRGKRLVNWDTQLQTAVADDEVYHEEVKGHFYHFKYPIIPSASGVNVSASSPVGAAENSPGRQPWETDALYKSAPEGRQNASITVDATVPTHVLVATTRPETMLGDTAVAVHPEPDVALDKAEAELRAKLAEAPEKEKGDILAAIDGITERRKSLLPTLLKLRDMAKAGRKVMLPLIDREIPLICDTWAKPELGSGCVKITPAHDPNDHDVAQRHDLPKINIMTPDGRVNENGGKYKGQKFADARKNVVADMEALGLVEKIEERQIDLGHSDRSNTPIEPYLSDQWFVRMGDLEPEHAAKIEGLRHHAPGLAQMAIDAVKRGDVKFHPPRYENSYVDWLGEKRDWCISRQLWWGHRIPVWSKPFAGGGAEAFEEFLQRLAEWKGKGRVFVWGRQRGGREHGPVIDQHETYDTFFVCVRDANDAEVVDELNKWRFEQDSDVLDTWFSSALWPHSTLGWPNLPGASASGSDLLSYFYPTSVLSTAREIITLWVARMVITGLYNMGDVPFADVVIHSVIQDGQGRKMSKTLGNGVDPVDIIDEYGADALRFTLAELATETQDIRLPVKPKKLPDGRTINVSEKFEKGRNFCNKLWQASTGFVMRNLEGYEPAPLDPKTLSLADRWILSRLTACQQALDEALARYRFSEAAGALYHFMWDEYCSWYIEMTKPRLVASAVPADDEGRERQTAQTVLVFVLDRLLRMLHPFVPFVTEAIWAELNKAAPRRGLRSIKDPEPALVAAAWPEIDADLRDEAAEAEMAELMTIIRGLRDIRADVNDNRGRAKQPSIRSLPKAFVRAEAAACSRIEIHRALVQRLGGVEALEASPQAPKPHGAMSRVNGSIQVFAPVADLIDLAEVKRAEQARMEELRAALAREETRLSNEQFVSRADPAVVSQAKQRAADLSSQIETIAKHLADME